MSNGEEVKAPIWTGEESKVDPVVVPDFGPEDVDDTVLVEVPDALAKDLRKAYEPAEPVNVDGISFVQVPDSSVDDLREASKSDMTDDMEMAMRELARGFGGTDLRMITQLNSNQVLAITQILLLSQINKSPRMAQVAYNLMALNKSLDRQGLSEMVKVLSAYAMGSAVLPPEVSATKAMAGRV